MEDDMKLNITRENERGHVDHGWLNARHYFSFGKYYDPAKMGFGKLKVINNDLIAPANGFAKHPHDNMEIITIPLEGAVKHKDSEGNSGVIGKGEVQVMSAGTGILHSEHNNSQNENLKLFQIWIEPNQTDVKPRYEQKDFSKVKQQDAWTQVVGPMTDALVDFVQIHQSAYISIGEFNGDTSVSYTLKDKKNGLYLLVVEGAVSIGSETLRTKDAVSIEDFENLKIDVLEKSELLAIEVPLS